MPNLYSRAGSALVTAAAKREVNTSHVLDVVQACRVMRNVIGIDVGVQIIHFNRPNLHVRGNGNIEATAELHGETVIVAISSFRAARIVALEAADHRGITVGVEGPE